MAGQDRLYARLAPGVVLRRLEEPCLYDIRGDELYELNKDGFSALARCRGDVRLSELSLEPEFEAYCLQEGLIELSPSPWPLPLPVPLSPRPSLRYLELQITWRCNLSCGHCYLGPARGVDLSVNQVAELCREFEAMAGLRLLISGGEPLMHPHWPQINAVLAALKVRRVLLSNGLLLDDDLLAGLNCQEVQISLDGLKAGHEALRGPGSYAKAHAAARRVTAAGLELSIATMVHAGNLEEIPQLAQVVQELGAREWGIDAPCITGRLGQRPELAVEPKQAAQAMSHAFGGAYHGGSNGMACGLHLCTVSADGVISQCGFYHDQPLGQAPDGLETAWSRRQPMELAQIPACATCEVAQDCGGGCRFRAPAIGLPDAVMCAAYGMNPAKE